MDNHLLCYFPSRFPGGGVARSILANHSSVSIGPCNNRARQDLFGPKWRRSGYGEMQNHGRMHDRNEVPFREPSVTLKDVFFKAKTSKA